MARTKKIETAAEAAAAAAAEVTAAPAAAPAAEAPAEKKKPGRKPAEKKAAAKKAPAEKKTAAKKAPAAKKTAAKKATAAKAAKNVIKVQFGGSEYELEAIKAAVDADVKEKFTGKVKSLEIYVKPEEALAYYVVNSDFQGKVAL